MLTLIINSPANETAFVEMQAFAGTFAQSCLELSSPKGLIAHMTTPNNVQDWNSVREALGYEEMNFLAWS